MMQKDVTQILMLMRALMPVLMPVPMPVLMPVPVQVLMPVLMPVPMRALMQVPMRALILALLMIALPPKIVLMKLLIVMIL